MIDCEQIAKTLKEKIRLTLSASQLQRQNPLPPPTLAAVQVGDNPASSIYVRNKMRNCEEVGIHSVRHLLPATSSESEIITCLERLSGDPAIHGILLQLPLPSSIDPSTVIRAIDPSKDVDGLHPFNLGLLLSGERTGYAPCTPLGIVHLLEASHVTLPGAHVVIAGRSNIVGKPLAALLMQKARCANATVTVVHSQTPNIAKFSREADILVAAIGSPRFFGPEMITPGTVVVDVGINRIPDSSRKSGTRLVGDVDFDAISPHCPLITPVPKGVGLMTIAMLLRNTLIAYQRQCSLETWTW